MKTPSVVNKKIVTSLLILFFFCSRSQSILPSCQDSIIYMSVGNNIMKYNPWQALSATNPTTYITVGVGNGLALCNNLNGGVSPTFYTIYSNQYWYWTGTNWFGTGHGTGNNNALNITGGGCYIYNLVGSTGEVYQYNGTGTSTLLTTIAGFNGGGPYDLAADVDGSFYAIRTATPGQFLRKYDYLGNLTQTFSINGIPSANAGGGLSVSEKTVYVHNFNGFYKGLISGSTVNFSLSAPSNSFGPVGDMANCPSLTTGTLNYNFSNTGLSCTTNTTSLIASGWPAGTTYTWSGPGIYGNLNNSTATASLSGLYTCTLTAPGNCPTILTTSVTAAGNFPIPVIASNTLICSGSTAMLLGSGCVSYTWSPSSSLSSSNGNLVTASPTITTTYTVTGTSSGTCAAAPSVITINVTTCAGINSFLNNEILNLYPNPSNGEFIIKATKDIKAKLINELGQVVYTLDLNEGNNYKVTISKITNGIYFIVSDEPGKVFTRKVVVLEN